MIELFELEELAKSVNRGSMKAYLRNAAILKDPNASQEMKELAASNVRALVGMKPSPKAPAQKQPQQKAAAPEQATQLAQTPPTQTPSAAAPSKDAPVEFHHEFAQHHGLDPSKFAQTFAAMTPEQQKITQDWHAEQVAAAPKKVAASAAAPAPAVKPTAAPMAPQPIKVVNNAVTPSASQPPHKMAKNVDALYDLFVELKKRL